MAVVQSDRPGALALAQAEPHGDIDLRRYGRVLKRWSWLIALIAINAAVLAWWLEDAKTPVYRSVATIELGNAATSGLQQIADRELTTEAVVLRSSELLEATRDALGDLGPELLGISAQPIENSSAITLSFDATDPVIARDAAQLAIDKYSVDRAAASGQDIGTIIQALSDQIGSQSDTVNELAAQVEVLRRDGASQAAIDTADELRAQAALRLATLQQELLDAKSNPDILSGDVAILTGPSLETGPISPNPTRAAAIGFVGGLVLSTFAVAALSAIRDRISVQSDVTSIAGDVPILATIPSFKRATRGPQLPMVAKGRSSGRDKEAFRFLSSAVELLTIDMRPVSVLLTSAAKGEGKTTMATNLSFALAQSDHDVSLIDGDLYSRGATRVLGVKPEATFLDVLREDAKARDSVVPVGRGARVDVLAAGRLPSGMPSPMTVERLRAAVEDLVARSDFVVVDSPPVLAMSAATVAASVVDVTIIVVRMNKTRRRDLRRTLGVLEQAGAEFGGIAITDTKAARDSYYVYGE